MPNFFEQFDAPQNQDQPEEQPQQQQQQSSDTNFFAQFDKPKTEIPKNVTPAPIFPLNSTSKGLAAGLKEMDNSLSEGLPAAFYAAKYSFSHDPQDLLRSRAHNAEYQKTQQFIEQSYGSPFESVGDAMNKGKDFTEKVDNVANQWLYNISRFTPQGAAYVGAGLVAATGVELAAGASFGAAVTSGMGSEGLAALASTWAKRRVMAQLATGAGTMAIMNEGPSYLHTLNDLKSDNIWATTAGNILSSVIMQYAPLQLFAKELKVPAEELATPVINTALQKLGFKSFAKETAKTATNWALSGAAAGQVQSAVDAFVSDNWKFFSRENFDKLLDDTFTNFGMGLVFGGVTSAPKHVESMFSGRQKNDYDHTDVTKVSTPVVETPPDITTVPPKRPTRAGKPPEQYVAERKAYEEWFQTNKGTSPEEWYKQQARTRREQQYPKYEEPIKEPPTSKADFGKASAQPKPLEVKYPESKPATLAPTKTLYGETPAKGKPIKWGDVVVNDGTVRMNLEQYKQKFPNVQDRGDYKILYHATPAENVLSINRQGFRIGSHFGTAKSAEDRSKIRSANLKGSKDFEKDSDHIGMTTYPVKLEAKNSVEIPDLGYLGDSYSLVQALTDKRNVREENSNTYKKLPNVLTPEEVKQVMSLRKYFKGGTREEEYNNDLPALKKLIDILESKGYDSFKYRNEVEDRDNYSYMNFRPEQVKSIFEPSKESTSKKIPEAGANFPRDLSEKPLPERKPTGPSKQEFTGSEVKKAPLDPKANERRIQFSSPTVKFTMHEHGLPKTLDTILEDVGLKPGGFEAANKAPLETPASTKMNLANVVRIAIDKVLGRAKTYFSGDPVGMEQLFYHFKESSLTPEDLSKLDESYKQIIDTLASIPGMPDVRDLQTQYTKDQILATAFTKYSEEVYQGKPPKFAFDKASGVFNKINNALQRMGQVLNAHSIKGVGDYLEGVSPEHIQDEIYRLNKERNEAQDTKRMGDTLYQVSDLKNRDELLDQMAKDPGDIKHLTFWDDQLGTIQWLATKYPWFSPVAHAVIGRLRRVSEISKDTGTMARKVQRQYPAQFNMAMDILNSGRMNGTRAKVDVDPSTGKQYLEFTHKDGTKRRIDDPVFINNFEQVRNTFRKVIEDDEKDFRKELSRQTGLAEGSSLKTILEYKSRLEEQLKAAGPRDPLRSALSGQIDYLGKLHAALGNIQAMKNTDYAPHLRFGDRVAMVFQHERDPETDELTGNKKLVFLHTQEEDAKGRIRPIHEQDLRNRLKAYEGNPDYEIVGKNPNQRNRLTHNEILKGILPQHISMELIYTMLGNPKAEVANAVDSLIERKLGEKRLAFYEKPSENIDGYSEDWPRVLETFIHARSLVKANRELAPEMARIHKYVAKLRENGQYHPRDIDYIDSFLKYNDSREADHQLMRSMNFLWAMGLNFKTATLQLFNGPQLLVPSLGLGGGSRLWIQGMWTKAFKDAVGFYKQASKGGGFELKDNRLWDAAVRQGKLTPEQGELMKMYSSSHLPESVLLGEGTGTSYESRDKFGRFKSGAQAAAQLMGSMVAAGEQISRLTSVLTSARVMSDPRAFENLKKAYESDPGWQEYLRFNPRYTTKEALTFYIMEKAHGMYGRAGRGKAQRGMASAVFFPFSTQPLTQWELFKDMAMTKGTAGKISAMYMLGTFLALSGLTAVPGYQTLRALYNIYDALYNALSDVPTPAKDFDIDLSRWLENALGPDWANIVQKGVARQLTGVDVGPSVNLPTSFEQVMGKFSDLFRQTLLGTTPDYSRIAPPALSIPANLANAVNARDLGEALPTSFKNIKTAMWDMNPKNPLGSVQTRKGTPIAPAIGPDGKPLFNPLERVAKGLGFEPTKDAQIRQAYYEATFGDTANKARTSKIVDRAIESRAQAIKAWEEANKALSNGDTKKYNELMAMSKGYFNEVDSQLRNWINFQKELGNTTFDVSNFNNAVINGALAYKQGAQPKTKRMQRQYEDIKRRTTYQGIDSGEEKPFWEKW